MSDVDRLMKLATCSDVTFFGKDPDGDYVHVKLDGKTAQNILTFLQKCIDTPDQVKKSDALVLQK